MGISQPVMFAVGLSDLKNGRSADDPHPVIDGRCVERLVSPKAAVVLLGSPIGAAYDPSWAELCCFNNAKKVTGYRYGCITSPRLPV